MSCCQSSTIAGLLAFLVCILSALATFLNPKECSNTHKNAGNNYGSLLASVRVFWTIDCRREDSVSILADRLKDFSARRDQLNRDCSQPPKWAYDKAKKGIDAGEAEYKVDEKPVT